MFKCQYKNCNGEAASVGTILTLNRENPSKDIPVKVYACTEHSKNKSFFKEADIEEYFNKLG